jgi:hypothetical protein
VKRLPREACGTERAAWLFDAELDGTLPDGRLLLATCLGVDTVGVDLRVLLKDRACVRSEDTRACPAASCVTLGNLYLQPRMILSSGGDSDDLSSILGFFEGFFSSELGLFIVTLDWPRETTGELLIGVSSFRAFLCRKRS